MLLSCSLAAASVGEVLEDAREKERRTSGESSSSTESAHRAVDARRCVGKGIWIVLFAVGGAFVSYPVALREGSKEEGYTESRGSRGRE